MLIMDLGRAGPGQAAASARQGVKSYVAYSRELNDHVVVPVLAAAVRPRYGPPEDGTITPDIARSCVIDLPKRSGMRGIFFSRAVPAGLGTFLVMASAVAGPVSSAASSPMPATVHAPAPVLGRPPAAAPGRTAIASHAA